MKRLRLDPRTLTKRPKPTVVKVPYGAKDNWAFLAEVVPESEHVRATYGENGSEGRCASRRGPCSWVAVSTTTSAGEVPFADPQNPQKRSAYLEQWLIDVAATRLHSI